MFGEIRAFFMFICREEVLGGSLESLAIKLADYVIPFLTDLVEKLTS